MIKSMYIFNKSNLKNSFVLQERHFMATKSTSGSKKTSGAGKKTSSKRTTGKRNSTSPWERGAGSSSGKKSGLYTAIGWIFIICILIFSYLKPNSALNGLIDKYFGNSNNATPVEVSTDLLVHYIDVGQGDSILIQNQGMNMLIDAGESKSASTIISYLNDLGVTTLDYVIVTHPHSDHMGGMAKVFDAFVVKNVFLSNGKNETVTNEKLLDKIVEEDGCIFYYNGEDIFKQTLSLGEATFKFLAPNEQYKDLNDYSLGIMLTFGEKKFLFYGDGSELLEKKFLAYHYDVQADVLKVSHHGSSTASCKEFLQAVDPTWAIISCGVDNSYGHPHAETISNLEDEDIMVYRTDELGTIVATCDGKQITFKSLGKK